MFLGGCACLPEANEMLVRLRVCVKISVALAASSSSNWGELCIILELAFLLHALSNVSWFVVWNS